MHVARIFPGYHHSIYLLSVANSALCLFHKDLLTKASFRRTRICTEKDRSGRYGLFYIWRNARIAVNWGYAHLFHFRSCFHISHISVLIISRGGGGGVTWNVDGSNSDGLIPPLRREHTRAQRAICSKQKQNWCRFVLIYQDPLKKIHYLICRCSVSCCCRVSILFAF